LLRYNKKQTAITSVMRLTNFGIIAISSISALEAIMRAVMILLLSVSSPTGAFAWGEEGHAIIAEIAQRRLSPEAAAMVETLLGRGHSLASIASWADDFRATDEGAKTANWHFVNIPILENDYVATRDCKPNPEKGDCIVAELNRLLNDHELHCVVGKDEDQVRALKLAVHLVGDIHQPLHTVDELGGANGVEVGIYMEGVTCDQKKFKLKCSPLAATDLHTLWDSILIQRQYWSWGKYVDDLEDPEKGWLNSKDAQGVVSGEPLLWAQQWAVETHALAQKIWNKTPQAPHPTPEPPPPELKNTVLDDQYLKATDIINRQLGVAGLRLATFLNKAYASCPMPHS
jgi:hypothetical protein